MPNFADKRLTTINTSVLILDYEESGAVYEEAETTYEGSTYGTTPFLFIDKTLIE